MKKEDKLDFVKEALDEEKIHKSTENWYFEKIKDLKISLASRGQYYLETHLEYIIYEEFLKSLEGLEKVIKNSYKEQKEKILNIINELENEGYLKDEIFNNRYARILEVDLRTNLSKSKMIKILDTQHKTEYELKLIKVIPSIPREEFREVLVNFFEKYKPEYFEVRYRQIQSIRNILTGTSFYFDYIYLIQEKEGDDYKNPLDQFLLNESTNDYDTEYSRYGTMEDYIDEVFFEKMYVEEFEGSLIGECEFQGYASEEEEERDRVESLRWMEEEGEKEFQKQQEEIKKKEESLKSIVNLEYEEDNNDNLMLRLYSDEELAKKIIEKVTEGTKSEYIIDNSEWSMARFDKNILNYVKSVRLKRESKMMTEEQFNNLVESLNLEKSDYKNRFLKKIYTKEEAADALFLEYYRLGEKNLSYSECRYKIKNEDLKIEMTKKEFEEYISSIISFYDEK